MVDSENCDPKSRKWSTHATCARYSAQNLLGLQQQQTCHTSDLLRLPEYNLSDLSPSRSSHQEGARKMLHSGVYLRHVKGGILGIDENADGRRISEKVKLVHCQENKTQAHRIS